MDCGSVSLIRPTLPTQEFPGIRITGAGKMLLLDEGLQQHAAVAIAVMQIKREQACSHAQQLRGEVLGHDPGEDEEAGVVHDQVQPTLALSAVPANERVAGCGFPRCCAETRQGGDAALGTGEAAKLGPGQWLVAEVVVAVRR